MDQNVGQANQAGLGAGMLSGLPPEIRIQVLEELLKQLINAQSEIRFRYTAMEFAVRCVHVESENLVNLAKQIEKYLKGPLE